MDIQICRFVDISEIFEGLDAAHTKFFEQDLPFSFGDNNRSLVVWIHVVNAIENIEGYFLYDSEEEWDDEDDDLAAMLEFRQVVERLKSLPEGVYVDLEN